MAGFDEKYWGRWTSTYNQFAPLGYTYTAADDTVALVSASAYFNDRIRSLAVGTLIWVIATDGSVLLEVTSVTTNVTTQVVVQGGNVSKIVWAGAHTTVGGAAAEAITLTGLLATDIPMVVLKTQGASPQTILTTVATADTLTVTFSADPSTDHVLYYTVFRPH
jgi:hypothetical protein